MQISQSFSDSTIISTTATIASDSDNWRSLAKSTPNLLAMVGNVVEKTKSNDESIKTERVYSRETMLQFAKEHPYIGCDQLLAAMTRTVPEIMMRPPVNIFNH
jgi:hypothetical protein